MLPWLGIGWPLTTMSGWGVFGLNLALELLSRGAPQPLMLHPFGPLDVGSDIHRQVLDTLKPMQERIQASMAEAGDRVVNLKEATVLHSLGNQFVHSNLVEAVRGRHTVGVIFFEDTHIGDLARRRASQFERIICGSSWNRDILTARGFDNVRLVLQGIDPMLFRPGPRLGLYGDRFVIFSGGKLEFRKGQDIVLAAFKIFHARHPDSLLVTAWQNTWTSIVPNIVLGGHVDKPPEIIGQNLDIAKWATDFGLPQGSVIDLGLVTNYAMPNVLREAHCAALTSRSEGGTNLVAMEAMACGLPCVLSANTGHLDIIDGEMCFPLRDQRPVRDDSEIGTEGWGESSVEELVETLERIYTDRAEAARRSSNAAAFMRKLTWRDQAAKLLHAIDDLD